MKTTILKVIGALAFACLVLDFSPALFNNTNLAWVNLDSLLPRHNFYFGKRQWLADARTIVAAIRYLYQAKSANPAGSINVVSNAPLAFIQPESSENLLLIDSAESPILFHQRRLSRAENLIVRKRLLSYYGVLTSDREMESRSATFRPALLQRSTIPTNAAARGVRNLPHAPGATDMQGA